MCREPAAEEASCRRNGQTKGALTTSGLTRDRDGGVRCLAEFRPLRRHAAAPASRIEEAPPPRRTPLDRGNLHPIRRSPARAHVPPHLHPALRGTASAAPAKPDSPRCSGRRRSESPGFLLYSCSWSVSSHVTAPSVAIAGESPLLFRVAPTSDRAQARIASGAQSFPRRKASSAFRACSDSLSGTRNRAGWVDDISSGHIADDLVPLSTPAPEEQRKIHAEVGVE